MNLVGTELPDVLKMIVYAIVAVVGGVGGWLMRRCRDIAEIQKAKAEVEQLKEDAIEKAGSALEKLQAKRRSFNDSCEQCNRHLRKMLSLMREGWNDEDVRGAREGFCDALSQENVPAFREWAEWEQLRLRNNADYLTAYIKDEFVFQLDRWAKWIGVINTPSLLEALHATQYKISEPTVRPFRQIVLSLSGAARLECQTLVDDSIERVLSA